MKKISLISGSVLLLICGAWIFLGSGNQADKNEFNYSTAKAARRTIEQYVTSTGVIKPKIGSEVKVGAQVSGIVKKLYVEIGSSVRKGDLLAEIEPSGYKAKVDLVAAQKIKAETEKKFAELDLKRYLSLIESGGISKQQLESTEKAFELASSQLMQTTADLNYATLQLGYTKIYSPIDGIVSSVATQEGETVAASFASPTFVTIIDLNRLEVWAYVDETDIGRINVSQDVKFSVDTYPGKEFIGKVEAIYPKAEIQNNVVNYITVVGIEKKDGKVLRPEMTASVRIVNGIKENVLTVLKGTIKNEDGKTFVYTIRNGNPEKRIIETGTSDKKYSEVVSGLKEGEQVITSEIKKDN